MRLKTFGPAIAITLIGFLVAWQFVNPAPPHTITIATGQADGAYYLFAERYREILAEDAVSLEIRRTAGALENLRLLEAGEVDLAFFQGGLGISAADGGITALGSLYFEPLWVFYRYPEVARRLTDFQGRRLATGATGSGTRALALALLADNRIDSPAGSLQALGGKAAVQALRQDTADAAFFVASPRSPLIQDLLHDGTMRLMSFTRAAAYTDRNHALAAVILPEGVIDLQANIPPQDVTLLASVANLVARDNFHPALVNLVLQAATRVHGGGGLFEKPDEFPSAKHVDFPLDEDARRFYRHGPPLLQRYLPFWTANLIDRMKIMLVPLLTILVPLVKIMPPTYRWQVRRKIYRWYHELHAIDIQRPELAPVAQLTELLQRLDAIEEDVRKVRVPLSYSDELYNLRLHIGMIRNRLQDLRSD
ncbi:MAG: TAXI family TRAP transporter solute-binding subunit [Gammaproteobacteria bacterium]